MQTHVEAAGIEHAAELPSLPQFVYAKLHQEILSGAYAEGALLRQETIADKLGVSRLPVREALARLEADGLVVSRPRRGYAVALLDVDEIGEIFELRAMLEERAGSLAAQRRTPQDIAEVRALLAEMDGQRVSTIEDVRLFAVRNRKFHSRMFECSRAVHTCRLMLMLRNNVERYIQVGAWMLGTLDYGHKDHRAIFEAFRDGNAARTGMLCRKHVAATGERLIAMISEQRRARGHKRIAQ